MRSSVFAALLTASAGGLLLTAQAAAENKAEIVWDKVQQCTDKLYEDLRKCPAGSGFSADLCRKLTNVQYEECKQAAHDSILEAPAQTGGGFVVKGVRQPQVMRPVPKLQAAPQ